MNHVSLPEHLESSTPLVHHPFTNSFAGSTKNRQRVKKSFVYRCKSANAHSPASWRKTPAMYLSAFHSFAIYFQKYINNMNQYYSHISQRFATCHAQTWCISFTYILPTKIATQSRKHDVHQKHHAVSHPIPLCQKHVASSSHVFNLPSLKTHQKQPWSRTSKLESISVYESIIHVVSQPPCSCGLGKLFRC